MVIADRQARHDALVRPVIQDVVAAGGGLRLAVARLIEAGVPPPRPGAAWSPKSVWRICQRLGIPLAAPGGIHAYQWPTCVVCGRRSRSPWARNKCAACYEAAFNLEYDRRQRQMGAHIDPPDPLPKGPKAVQHVEAERPPARYRRERLKKYRRQTKGTSVTT